MPMNQQMQHHHGDVPLVEAEYPRMGRAQENAAGAACHARPSGKNGQRNESNVASSGSRNSRVRKRASNRWALYPNPSVGYTGDEIRGGSVGGGKQGFFVQQTIVTAGKLGKSREVLGEEVQAGRD